MVGFVFDEILLEAFALRKNVMQIAKKKVECLRACEVHKDIQTCIWLVSQI